MKITTLLETNTTPSSDPAANQSQQAPKFGRDPHVLEDEQLDEMTAGAIATGEPANLGVQRRGKGSMLQGIKTSKKFPNSAAVKEGVAEDQLEEYGDTAKGQKMLAKVHHRAADRVTSKQADKDPAYARKAQQTQDRAWDRLAVKEQGVAEGFFDMFKSKKSEPNRVEPSFDNTPKQSSITAEKPAGEKKPNVGPFQPIADLGTAFSYVKIKFNGQNFNLGLKTNTTQESKFALEEVKLLRKTIQSVKKDIKSQMSELRQAHTDRVANRGAMIPGGGKVGTILRYAVRASRAAQRGDISSTLKAVQDTVIAPLDQMLLICDKFEIHLKKEIISGNMGESVQQGVAEEKQRLDPKCWTGYKKQGTKMKGGVRVNNCVPVKEAEKYPEPEQEVIDATRRARLQREREPRGSEKIDAMLAQRNAQLQQYNETGKFWLKKKDTQEHISDAYVGKAAANQAALQLLKQHPELKGNIVITAWGPGETPVNEAELSEEQLLARDLKKQLELFKQAVDHDLGTKPNDKELGKKPKDKEVQKKK